MLLIVPVVALKVADVVVAATVTEAGTVKLELALVRVMLAPPAGAGWVNVTVQVVEELGPTLAGEHASDETSTAAARVKVVFAELLL